VAALWALTGAALAALNGVNSATEQSNIMANARVEPHELVEVAYFELISRPFFELFTT
jgi:hypothetical protein